MGEEGVYWLEEKCSVDKMLLSPCRLWTIDFKSYLDLLPQVILIVMKITTGLILYTIMRIIQFQGMAMLFYMKQWIYK